ncbi:gluconolactonase [Actinopolymorpha cephalotaxi]|uniref:Gluconolactonase n=1 Tax=Actinopolymorpha cephalotaxi TaxID=504797 RepID=A0A1I3AG63_9ACTN|nr:SMP-30/gluconolactonase/LRE family protein [Actinopolymorpha cephalotaxi]NYH82115.1 gluconolactonase [Actinopolymorpha cephalotaxi]SFH48846.1 gluconolactonase [Actinopolymorpha cephalotaxi]
MAGESERFEIIDERFSTLVKTSAQVERLYQGCRWAEGPAYFPAGRYLVWSDIPNDRMLRWDETTGAVGVFREPAGFTNGNTVDRQGRLVTCEHGNRRVTRTEHDGSLTVLTDNFGGKRYNSPNDVVVKSDGSVWFTDPAYGIDSDYEGHQADSEIGACHVYRWDATTGEVRIVADDFVRPNGLAFSPDETLLYVSDTGSTHHRGGPRHLRVLDVAPDGTQGGGKEFATCTSGLFDGFRLDTAGRIWASAADGVHCYHPDGTLLGKILVPETVANVEFGGPRRNRLFIAATTSLYSVLLPVNGALRR